MTQYQQAAEKEIVYLIQKCADLIAENKRLTDNLEELTHHYNTQRTLIDQLETKVYPF